jgi:hypothetical protein
MSSQNGMQKTPPENESQSISRTELGEPDDGGSLPSQALKFAAVASMPRPDVAPIPQWSFPSMARRTTASVPGPANASMPMSMSMSRPPVASIPGPSAASMPRPVATAQPTTAPSPATPEDNRRRNPVVVERENFLVFIKILFKILEEAQEPETKSKAQRIVMECRRRSKQGDPNFIPMMDAVELRLRSFVGEAKWRRAHLFLHHYISNDRAPPRMAATMRRPTALCAGK